MFLLILVSVHPIGSIDKMAMFTSDVVKIRIARQLRMIFLARMLIREMMMESEGEKVM